MNPLRLDLIHVGDVITADIFGRPIKPVIVTEITRDGHGKVHGYYSKPVENKEANIQPKSQ